MTRFLVAPDPSGRWLAVAAGDVLLLVRAGASIDAVALLDTLQRADPVRDLLDSLTAAGLSSTPHFALVEWTTDGARVIARGDVTVVGTSPDGPVSIAGGGVATWVEHLVGGLTDVTVAAGADASEAPHLPLEVGAVHATAVVAAVVAADLGSPSARAPRPSTAGPAAAPAEPGPVPAPTPESELVAEPEPAPDSTPDTTPAPTSHIDDATVVVAQADIDDHTVVLGRRPSPATVTATASELRSGATAGPPPAPAATTTTATTASEATLTELHETRAPRLEPIALPDATAGDHDGATVMKSDVAGLRDRERPGASSSAGAPPVAAVTRFRLALSSGAREPLDGVVLIGRAPTAKMTGDRMPHLVTITGDPDLSRTHVQLALEGDTVVVTDLGSRNGTTIVLPGKPPQVLRAGDATPVIVGTLVDLGGGTTITIEHDAALDAALDAPERRD